MTGATTPPNMLFYFNERSKGIFADGYVDKIGLPVGDTFAYMLRAKLYGVLARDWSVARIAELIATFTSRELADMYTATDVSRFVKHYDVAVIAVDEDGDKTILGSVSVKAHSIVSAQTKAMEDIGWDARLTAAGCHPEFIIEESEGSSDDSNSEQETCSPAAGA